MDIHMYYEPPPDYSDSDDERQTKSLNPVQVRSYPRKLLPNNGFSFGHYAYNGAGSDNVHNGHGNGNRSRQLHAVDETANEINEVTVNSAFNIPRSNWTLQKPKPPVTNRTSIQVVTAVRNEPRNDPIKENAYPNGHHVARAPSQLFQQIRNRMQSQATSQATLPPRQPPPPPPPPPPPVISIIKTGFKSDQNVSVNRQSGSQMINRMTPSPTSTQAR